MELQKITGTYQFLPNRQLTRIGDANVKLIGGVPFTEEHQKIAEPFARSMGVQGQPLDTDIRPYNDVPWTWATDGASNDTGNVSWNVPMVRFSVANYARGTPGHSWQMVAQNALSPAFLGSLIVAKYMTATGLDLLADVGLIQEAKEEFDEYIEKYGAYVDPVAGYDFPSFKVVHNLEQGSVPRQWEVKPYPYPDFDKLFNTK